MKKNKILITGASGFVGKFLINELLKDHNNIITAFYNRSVVKDLFMNFEDKINWVKVDLVNDILDDIPEDINIVYHLAGYSSMGASKKELDLLNKVNVIATQRLANKCETLPIKHFIFVSSIAVCESSKSLVINEENGVPVTPYGISKRKAEKLLIKIAKGKFNVTILRPTALFGECHTGSVYEMTKNIKEKRFVKFGSGSTLTNFFYIKDFVSLLIIICNNKKTFNKVFIASDTPHDLDYIIDCITRCLNLKHRTLQLPLWLGYIFASLFEFASLLLNKRLIFSYRRFKAMINKKYFTNDKISKVVDLKYDYGVRKGLELTIKWYINKGIL